MGGEEVIVEFGAGVAEVLLAGKAVAGGGVAAAVHGTVDGGNGGDCHEGLGDSVVLGEDESRIILVVGDSWGNGCGSSTDGTFNKGTARIGNHVANTL